MYPMSPEEERMMRLMVQQQLSGQAAPPDMAGAIAAQASAPLNQEAVQAMGGMSAGMASPTVQPGAGDRRAALMRAAAQSSAGQAARLKNQQAYANSLRNSKTPGVRQIGNIAATNIWEGLETGFNRALGGYLSGRLDEEYDRLDQAEADTALAKLEYEDLLTQEERGFTAEQSALEQAVERELAAERNRVTERGQNITAASSAANTAATIRGQDLTAQTAASGQEAQNLRGQNVKTWMTPGGGPIQTIDRFGVQYAVNPDGTMGDPMQVPAGSFEVGTGSYGNEGVSSTAAREQMRQEQADKEKRWESEVGTQTALDEMGMAMDSFDRVLLNPDMDDYTGILSQGGVNRALSALGIGEDAWRGQTVDQQLRYATMGSLAELAAVFKPLSEGEGKKIDQSLATVANNPGANTAWFGSQGRDVIKGQYQAARREARTDAEKANLDRAWQQVNDRMNLSVATAALRQGIPASDARSLGMDEEELAYIYAMLRRQQGQ